MSSPNQPGSTYGPAVRPWQHIGIIKRRVVCIDFDLPET